MGGRGAQRPSDGACMESKEELVLGGNERQNDSATGTTFYGSTRRVDRRRDHWQSRGLRVEARSGSRANRASGERFTRLGTVTVQGSNFSKDKRPSATARAYFCTWVLDHFGVAIYAQIIPSAANQEKIVEAVAAISVFRPFESPARPGGFMLAIESLVPALLQSCCNDEPGKTRPLCK